MKAKQKRSMNHFLRWGLVAFSLISVLLGLLFFWWRPPVERRIEDENGLARKLMESGWTYVYEPRESFAPGTIVSLTEQDGLRYRGDINACVPEGVIVRQHGIAALPKFEGKWSLSGEAFARFVKLGNVSQTLTGIKRVIIQFGKASSETIDELRISNWLDQNQAVVSPTCQRYLFDRNIYMITEALRVEDYKYTFKDEANLDMRLSGELRRLFSSDLGAKVSFSETGVIEIRQPLYIAFRKAKYIAFDVVPGITASVIPTDVMKAYLGKKLGI